jgi:hypothetical protein
MVDDSYIGQVFGKLTVLAVERQQGKLPYAKVQCECGSEAKRVLLKNLKAGLTMGCGCLRVGNITHGLGKTKVYKAWQNMHGRVKTRERYKALGVCEAWSSFEQFYEDMGDLPFEGATLERKDNNKGYSKENCKWATRKEQQANLSNNVKLTVNGVEKPLAVWAQELGLDIVLLRSRVRAGITGEKVLSKVRLEATGPKVGKARRLFSNGEETLKMVELAKRLGINKSTASWRADKGNDLGGFYEIPLPV